MYIDVKMEDSLSFLRTAPSDRLSWTRLVTAPVPACPRVATGCRVAGAVQVCVRHPGGVHRLRHQLLLRAPALAEAKAKISQGEVL